MGKLAIHGQSYKKAQLAALDRHNFRLNQNYGNEFIDKMRSKDNIILIQPAGGLHKAAQKRLEEAVLPYAKRKLRSDANWASEFVVTLPKEVNDCAEIKRYCEIILEHFKDKIGADNLLSAVIHLDETTPHLHLDFIPIKNHKLTSKEVMTRSFLLSLHDDLPRLLCHAGFETERGTPVPNEEKVNKSRDIKQYKKDMEKEQHELKTQIKALTLIREKLLNSNILLAKQLLEKVYNKGQETLR